MYTLWYIYSLLLCDKSAAGHPLPKGSKLFYLTFNVRKQTRKVVSLQEWQDWYKFITYFAITFLYVSSCGTQNGLSDIYIAIRIYILIYYRYVSTDSTSTALGTCSLLSWEWNSIMIVYKAVKVMDVKLSGTYYCSTIALENISHSYFALGLTCH